MAQTTPVTGLSIADLGLKAFRFHQPMDAIRTTALPDIL
jgi:hypothetical protein